MDRRGFILKSLVIGGSFGIPLKIFGGGNTSDYVLLKAGRHSQWDLQQAIDLASSTGRYVVLDKGAQVSLRKALDLKCSLASNGGVIKGNGQIIKVASGNPRQKLFVMGARFENAQMNISSTSHVHMERNTIIGASEAPVIVGSKVSDLVVKKNKIVATQAHAISLRDNMAVEFTKNDILVKSSGEIFWLENSFAGVVANNTFRAEGFKSSLRPSVALINDSDLNPRIKIKNNKLA